MLLRRIKDVAAKIDEILGDHRRPPERSGLVVAHDGPDLSSRWVEFERTATAVAPIVP